MKTADYFFPLSMARLAVSVDAGNTREGGAGKNSVEFLKQR